MGLEVGHKSLGGEMSCLGRHYPVREGTVWYQQLVFPGAGRIGPKKGLLRVLLNSTHLCSFCLFLFSRQGLLAILELVL